MKIVMFTTYLFKFTLIHLKVRFRAFLNNLWSTEVHDFQYLRDKDVRNTEMMCSEEIWYMLM